MTGSEKVQAKLDMAEYLHGVESNKLRSITQRPQVH